MEKWKNECLGDYATFSQGIQIPIEAQFTQNDEGLVRFIRIVDYTSNGDEPPRYIAKPNKKYIVSQDDLVMIRYGSKTAGRVGMGLAGAIANNTFKIILNEEKLNPKYLFYFFGLEDIYKSLNSWQSSSTMPAITFGIINKFKVPIPPLPTQRKIAKILSAYDDLIENNLKRIKLLEETAQNEFDNWYANNEDFEEVNLGSIIVNEIGGGWGAEELSEEFSKPAYVIRGTDIDELPNGKLEKVPFRFHKKSNLVSRKLQDGDIIFEVSGGSSYEGVAKTLLVTDELLKQFDNAVMPASFCKLARPIERKYSNLLFLFWRFLRNIKGTEVFEIRSASNIVNYNWTAFLKFQKVKKPSDDKLKKFNKRVEQIYKQVYNLGNQNQRLKEARDILLPRLMTGMIDVSNKNLYSNNKKELLNLAAEPKEKYETN